MKNEENRGCLLCRLSLHVEYTHQFKKLEMGRFWLLQN